MNALKEWVTSVTYFWYFYSFSIETRIWCLETLFTSIDNYNWFSSSWSLAIQQMLWFVPIAGRLFLPSPKDYMRSSSSICSSNSIDEFTWTREQMQLQQMLPTTMSSRMDLLLKLKIRPINLVYWWSLSTAEKLHILFPSSSFSKLFRKTRHTNFSFPTDFQSWLSIHGKKTTMTTTTSILFCKKMIFNNF